MTANTYTIIIIYGSLLLLTFLLITNPLKVNKKANFWFGVFLFLWSTYWLEEIFELTTLGLVGDSIIIPVRLFQFFAPIVFYLSTLYYTNPDYKFKISDFKYLVLPFIYSIGLLLQVSKNNFYILQDLLVLLIIVQSIYYTIISYIKIKHHKKKINLFSSNTSEIDLNWLEYIITALLVLSIFIGLYNALFSTIHLNLFANIVSVIIVFFIAFNIIKQKEIFLLDEQERNKIISINQETNTPVTKIISDQNLAEIKQKLVQLMESQELFLDGELSLKKLADIMDITPHKLSYAINTGFHENFFMFVNKYRIDKAKELLLTKEKKYLSVLGIAFESGFNSKTAFNTTFKKITNQTPSQFKQSRQQPTTN